MVELRVCSFCGKEIEPGTGNMYIKKDGTVFLFCSNKCSKNMIGMRRVPRRITWTRAYAREKDVRMTGIAAAEEKAKKPEAPEPKQKKAAKVKRKKKPKAKVEEAKAEEPQAAEEKKE